MSIRPGMINLPEASMIVAFSGYAVSSRREIVLIVLPVMTTTAWGRESVPVPSTRVAPSMMVIGPYSAPKAGRAKPILVHRRISRRKAVLIQSLLSRNAIATTRCQKACKPIVEPSRDGIFKDPACIIDTSQRNNAGVLREVLTSRATVRRPVQDS